MKTYLGDGVYADFDGYGIVLTTENGISVTNTIVLEPEVYEALVAYQRSLRPPCQICGRETSGFDEHGPLCIDCAVVKAMKEGV